MANTSRKLSRPTRICVTGKLSQNCKLTTGQSPGKSCLDANWSFSKKWIFMKPDFKTAFETITKPPTLVSDVSFVVDPFSGCYSDFLFLPGMLCFFLPRILFRGFLSSQNVFTRQFSFFSGCYSYFFQDVILISYHFFQDVIPRRLQLLGSVRVSRQGIVSRSTILNFYFGFCVLVFISPQSERSKLGAFYFCPGVLSGYCCV